MSYLNRFAKDAKSEFLKNPLFCIWKLVIFPVAALSILFAALMVSLLNLSFKDGAYFLRQIF